MSHDQISIITRRMHALLARYAVYMRVTDGYKIMRVIAKLGITVWHHPGKIIHYILYIYI